MKRILGLGLLLMLSSVSLLAAKNSEVITLASETKVGTEQLPAGVYQATWTEAAGAQVQLTLKQKNVKAPKTVTVAARVVDGKQAGTSLSTGVVNGVTVLQEIQTLNKRIILADAATN